MSGDFPIRMETASLLLNEPSLLMDNKDLTCLICNSLTSLQTSYSIFYTVLSNKGTLLCNSVQKVIKRSVEPNSVRSTVLCNRCFSLFDELDACEERCVQLRQNIISWFNASCQVYGDLNALIVDGVATQTDPCDEQVSQVLPAENVPQPSPPAFAPVPIDTNSVFLSDEDPESPEDNKDDPDYVDEPRSIQVRSKIIGPLTKEAMRRLRRYRHQCEHCDRMFRRPSELKKHILSHIGAKPFGCSKCDKRFASKQGVTIHLLRSHGVEAVADVDAITEDTAMIESLKNTSPDPGDADQPGMETRSASLKPDLANDALHEFSETDGISDVFNSVPDDYDDDFEWKEDDIKLELMGSSCDTVVKYEPELEFQHPVLKAEKRGRKPKNKPSSDSEAFRDEDCESKEDADEEETKEKTKKVRKKRGNRASERYSMPAIHECDQCGKKWRTVSELKSHIASHSTLRPYVCEICGQAYKMRKALDIHVGMHNGIHPYTCHICNKSFTQKVGLQKHLPIHTGYTRFQCDLCGKRFIHHKSFNIHKMTHTGEKTIKCTICGLAVLSQSHLKRHYRVHTGERPYACEICGKRFAEKYNLNAHGRVHDPESALDSSRKKVHRCPLCGICYDRKHKLEDHLAATHNKLTEDKPVTNVVLGDHLQAITVAQTMHVL